MSPTRLFKHIIVFTLAAISVGGCSAPKLTVAQEQMARGEYFDAATTYRRVYNRLTKPEDRPLRGQVAWEMAECYRHLRQSARATASYRNALRYAWPDSMVHLRLAQSLQSEGKWAEAINAYTDFLATNPKASTLAEAGIDGCRRAIASKSRPTRYVVKPAKTFNSRRSDFSPLLAGEKGDVVYFTSTSDKSTGSGRSEITGTKRSDLWMSRQDEQGVWLKPELVEGDLNTNHDEGIISLSPDGSTMYLTRARREPNHSTGVEICTSQRSDAKWSTPVKFDITSDTLSSYGHPAVSPSGEWLYFTSDMLGGMGGKDLWRINLKERGGSLENLGEFINTPGDEMFPYLRTDSVLYFASDGHAGFGGLDLFKATLRPSGGWSVENMGTPVNSPSDDFGITFAPGSESGFFSSNRGDARGYDNIYSFVLPDLRINISGSVTDHDEEPVATATIRIVGDDGSNRKATGRTDGTFSFPLQRGVRYVMQAGAPGYLNASQEFTSDTAEVDADYVVDFVLASINKPNVVENIFYDFDRATLRQESLVGLDSLVDVLRDNPDVAIEMASHTDRHGTDDYNMSLSQRRAQTVVDYLIAHGVDPSRLRPKGYGRSRPKSITRRLARLYPQFPEGTELTEEYILSLPTDEDRALADQINRRTEFQVITTLQ